MMIKYLNKFPKQLTNTFKSRFHQLNDISSLSEEEIFIQQSALDFANTKIKPFAAEWDRNSHFPIDMFKEAATMGFSNIYISQENGGCGLSRLSASLIFEALATACVSSSSYISIHNMNLWILDQYGNNEQQETYMQKMIDMELFSSYCLTEPGSGSDAGAMKTLAVEDGDDFILNGSKTFISGGSVSDLYFVMCKTGEKEKSCILVPKDAKGLSFGKKELKMGWKSSPTTMVIFEDCRVPKKNLIGNKGDGFKIALKALDGGRINIASTSLGAAAHTLALARDYMHERKQFGKALSEFQHLQFKLSDMATGLITSRLLVRDAARKLDADDPNKSLYSAMAKQYTTDTCYQIIDESLQIHGGYGYLNEYEIERYLRDTRVNRILEGTNEIMRLIISRKLLSSQ